jgi:hypothetical protein
VIGPAIKYQGLDAFGREFNACQANWSISNNNVIACDKREAFA